MSGPVPVDPAPLATAADFVARMPMVAKNYDELVIAETMVEATDHIENMVGRRLAPFSGHTYEDRLFGIDPDEMGNGGSPTMAMPWAGSLGTSYSNALGAGQLVRHFWLDQFAPFHPELWTYSIQSIVLDLTYGNEMTIDFSNGGLTGPSATDGHCWMRIGTFCPVGTRVKVVYGGGYTVAVPPALKRACIFQAAKFLMMDAEPMLRQQMNTDELDAQIVSILASWARG